MENWSTKLATVTSLNEFLTECNLRIFTMHYEALFENCYLEQIIAASHKQIKMDFSVPKFIAATNQDGFQCT